MPDSVLIAAPVLVLAVALLLGFAGCSFSGPANNPVPEPEPTKLTFRATVPTALTVIDGVIFAWKRPTATTEEIMTVTSFTEEAAGNVYEHEVPAPEPGMGWEGRCAMDVSEQGTKGDSAPPPEPFAVEPMMHSAARFETEGSPLTPASPFEVVFKGAGPA